MRKRERKQLIETMILQKHLSTQEELVTALRRHGASVTQATVSRDMRELGVQKGRDRDGNIRYFIPPPQVVRDPLDVLTRVLRDSAGAASQAQNLVVVRSEPGSAPTLARAVDELAHEDVVGTIAGDDTVLLVLKDNAKARKMTGFINELSQGQVSG